MKLPFAWEHIAGLFGLVLLIVGNYMGLVVVPTEVMMGDVSRILYVHVPAAWLSLVAFTIAFVSSLGHLANGKQSWDSVVEASCEVGVLLCTLLLILGSIFARPTWGVWWTWDPRLTASAIMLLTFIGVLMLRATVDEPVRRGLWTAVATVMAYITIPITYMSVRWWRSVHQLQSSPDTMSSEMVLVLRINAFAFLFLMIWFIARRWRLAQQINLIELPPELPQESV
jgi:heme exporter protein C